MRFALFAACFAVPAYAQNPNCAPPQVVVERLVNGYGERRVSIALGAGGTLVETWANLQSGTWTVVVTQPDGLACMVASGQSFELINEPQGVDG